MRKLGLITLGLLTACLCWTVALAQDQTAAPMKDSYGFTPDEIAVNQGAVVYWYAHGYANAFNGFPAKWADVTAKGLPLRKFESPHTGEAIDLDDGTLDFDGDMTYAVKGCDAEVQVQTTAGVVTLPGILEGSVTPKMTCNTCDKCNPCGQKQSCNTCNSCRQGNSCNTCNKCAKPTCNTCNKCKTRCCDITICGYDYWGCLTDQKAVCAIVQWIMWRSFETYVCRYGMFPCDETTWMASGLAPVDKNWKELAPFMEIEYVWGNCGIKKAKVACCNTCQPCAPKCNSCVKPACNSCEKPGCNTCKSKGCNSCAKPSCNNCGKPSCNKCAKPSCNKCGKPSCNSCSH